jgi:signal transduction histidine kinase
METSKINILHRPLARFYYGSLLVIVLALGLGSYYLSNSFLKNEKKRAEISSLQVTESLNSEYRYIAEEFFTNSYDSVFMRVSNSLAKFGSLQFDLLLYNNEGICLFAKDQTGKLIDCKNNLVSENGRHLYSTELKLGTKNLGRMKVLVEDRLQFFTGSTIGFAFKFFSPVFLVVIVLWGLWIYLSRKFILNPYYKQMIDLQKEKVSTDIVRQIIHDTKGEIASLDLLSYEIKDKAHAEELRTTLHNIRESFSNLSHHKEGVVTTVREVPHSVANLVTELIGQQQIKYKNNKLRVSIQFINELQNDNKIKVDANSFYRVFSNLIENAITAPNSDNNYEILFRAYESAESVFISITDNGDGISVEGQKRLFEKGFTTKANGSGQGLPFVKEMVGKWDGNISFCSKIQNDRGTTFTIEIPLYKKPKVVVLDDDTKLLFRYKKMLERFGNETEVFSDSASLFERTKYLDKETIFLLDFNLSDGTNGAEIAKKLSENGMENLYLHTGNQFIDKNEFPFVKDVLVKGNFTETISRIF